MKNVIKFPDSDKVKICRLLDVAIETDMSLIIKEIIKRLELLIKLQKQDKQEKAQ